MTVSGDKVKHYEILELIGKGGMGEVYLAHDSVLDRNVAIKFLPETMEQDPKARERFVREAKSAAALDHPFICKIYETGEADGKAFIVMEYIKGKTLKKKLQEEPITFKEFLRVALEIAEALETAHENGIVHRDLKPENIMLTPHSHVKVMDFGLAKRVFSNEDELTKTITQASATEEGAISGTLGYMSPEQARGENVDRKSDIFSLGIMLYEMISGEHPFSRPSAIETLSAILRDPPPHLKVRPKKVIPALSPILRKAVAKNPKDRYESIVELAVDIRKIQAETIGVGWHIFRRWQVMVGTILILVMLLTGVWWLSRRGAVTTPEAAPEPITVLVADFQNQTGDTVFDGALEQSLVIGLEDASFIDIYKRSKARRLLAQLDPSTKGRLDTQQAQLISAREDINVVVDGSIEQSQKGYTIRVRALDTVKNETVVETSEDIKTKADWYKAVGSLAAELRSELGGIPADSEKETFTTTSLVAMRAYVLAQELKNSGKKDESINEYLRAIEEDPEFGRAYSGLALIYYALGDRKKAEEYHSKALAHLDRMNDREIYKTRSTWFLLTGNNQKAIEELNTLVKQFPADAAGNLNLALAYFFARDMKQAVEQGLRTVEFFPKNFNSRYNLVWYAIGAGDFEMAEQQVQKVLEGSPEYEKAFVAKALAELAQGRSAQAIETYRTLEPISVWGASLAATGLADVALYEGRLNDATKILESGIKADLENGRKDLAAIKWTMLAHPFLLLGQKSRAIDAADKAIAISREVDVLFPAAQIYIRAGLLDKADVLAAELNESLYPEPQAYGKIIQGEILLEKGETSGAIRLFNEAKSLLDTWFGHFAQGRAYLRVEAFAEAHSEFDICLKRRGEAAALFFHDMPSYFYLPPVYYCLGRAQEGLGSNAASKSYKKFLEIKEKDEGDPMVQDARKRLISF
ncbi:MAG: protein kinase [Candidatus Aminicenantes bacterium]|nr:protein kinase [Candidatus Aminicenantes bacterium]